MASKRVAVSWGGPERDIFAVKLLDRHAPSGADPSEDEETLVYYRLLDEHGEATGEIVGFEIDMFLHFDRWDLIPDMVDRWYVGDEAPLPPVDLLKQLQTHSMAKTKVPVMP